MIWVGVILVVVIIIALGVIGGAGYFGGTSDDPADNKVSHNRRWFL